MIFITGPLYAGKRKYIQEALGLSDAEFARIAVWDVQEHAAERSVEALSQYEIVIATEVGGGVVPVSAEDRANREAAGRLACILAERADTVVRVCCGIPQLLKGEWPCRSG